jgi:hypothetical protein
MSKTTEINYWPHAILASIFAIILAIAYTIYYSLDYPVEMDETYLQNYHVTDKNINEMIFANIAFEKKYNFSLLNKGVKEGSNTLVYQLTSKATGENVANATINLRVTRPDTHDYDIDTQAKQVANGTYETAPIALNVVGRWNIITNVQVGEDKGYLNLKADTRELKITPFKW